MANLTKIILNRWDFTLHQKNDGGYILKVMFVEGGYKIDVARFFKFSKNEITQYDNLDYMKKLSENIRKDYEKYKSKEITKSEFDQL